MPAPKKKLLLVGGKGMLANRIVASVPDEFEMTSVDLPEFDITDRAQVMEHLARLKPNVIINCAAYTNVDGAESNRDLAMLVNGTAVGYLAEAARENDAILVHISTDYVFDGNNANPYRESDDPSPMSVYGHSKLLGEQSVIASGLTSYFIIRTSWLYGPGGHNFVETILRLAAEREELGIIDDQIGSPTYTGDLADAIFNLLALSSPRPSASNNGDSPHSGTAPYGIYHFSNSGVCSWYEFACAIVEEARNLNLAVKVKRINPIATDEYPLPARRPANSVFNKTKYETVTGKSISPWQDSLSLYFSIRE